MLVMPGAFCAVMFRPCFDCSGCDACVCILLAWPRVVHEAVAVWRHLALYMWHWVDGACRVQVRAMLNHYKSFANFPATLKAEVVEVETLVQSPATRRALQPLSHVPATTEFRLVEVDLSPLLPAEALAPFLEELKARAARRARERAREKREAARAKAAAAEEERSRRFDMTELNAMPLPHEVRLRQHRQCFARV